MKPGSLWSMGDYVSNGDRWAVVSRELAEATVEPGSAVLDVACGPGPFAIAAARAGARVTGLDAAPRLLEVAERRADDAGVAVEWIEADMTAVPFGDGAFDLVASAFGCMFAPDPEAMAAELVRLCRSGGRIAVLAWTPESAFGAMAPMAGPYLPNGGGVSPVVRWARPEHVEALFASQPVRLRFTARTVDVVWDDLDHAVRDITENNPPWLGIRAAVEPTGRWSELEADLRALLAARGHAGPDRFTLPVEYLETLAAKG